MNEPDYGLAQKDLKMFQSLGSSANIQDYLNRIPLTEDELALFKSLNTPAHVQDFLNKIPINFEEDGKDTCLSPRMVLRQSKCHCIEGAILAALILRTNGYPPLLVDLTANENDFDHVICVFQKDGMWGAISKTNHGILRYREPVYLSIRELAMSYFHEYINDSGNKCLISYSNPVDLSMFDDQHWMTTQEELWAIPIHLVKVEHFPIITKEQAAHLRKADQIEIDIGKITEWQSATP